MKKKKKINLSSIILAVIFAAGLSLLLYPSIASWWNSFHATRAVAGYEQNVKNLSTEDYQNLFEAATQYNETLLYKADRFFPTEEEHAAYEKLLSLEGDTVMGSIWIPSVQVHLPIYHGTSAEVLQVGAGHIEGTSLPVGGPSTHAVIPGHRGLPSAELFNNIVDLQEGDVFVLTVLNRKITYEVEKIRTVLPEEAEGLAIEPGRDLCTLVTCTPYGVNTHRVLITGHRTENLPDEYAGFAEATQMDTRLVALYIALPILLILFIVVIVRSRRTKEV